MSLAADTRRAVDARPFLHAALGAGVCNYTAAARYLAPELEGDVDVDAVATALRRYATELDSPGEHRCGETDSVQVRMESGLGPVEPPSDPVLSVGSMAIGADGDSDAWTAIVATGHVDGYHLARALESLAIANVEVHCGGFAGEILVVVVPRLDGANAVRVVERALE